MSNIAALAAALAAGGLSYLAIGKAFGTGATQPAAKRENRGGKAFKAFSAAVSRALPQSRTASLDAGAALLGYTLPEALGNLARRVEVPQVSMFAAAVSLAAEQGSSIGAVIESQAESARGAYFKELEEKANKLPTKMIVPMIFLILPSLFILTFTPLVLTLIDTL